jgi:hypothetical protein
VYKYSRDLNLRKTDYKNAAFRFMFGVKREVLDELYNNGEEIPITGLITGTLLFHAQHIYS